jgi:hypothetical protein
MQTAARAAKSRLQRVHALTRDRPAAPCQDRTARAGKGSASGTRADRQPPERAVERRGGARRRALALFWAPHPPAPPAALSGQLWLRCDSRPLWAWIWFPSRAILAAASS